MKTAQNSIIIIPNQTSSICESSSLYGNDGYKENKLSTLQTMSALDAYLYIEKYYMTLRKARAFTAVENIWGGGGLWKKSMCIAY